MTAKSVYIQISSSDIGLVEAQGTGATFAQSQPMNLQQSEPDIDALRERPYIPPWRDVSERDYLARSHPGPGAAEQAVEQALWEQVSGRSRPEVKVSPSMEAQWARFQSNYKPPSRRELDLETQLFEQVMASGFQPEDE